MCVAPFNKVPIYSMLLIWFSEFESRAHSVRARCYLNGIMTQALSNLPCAHSSWFGWMGGWTNTLGYYWNLHHAWIPLTVNYSGSAHLLYVKVWVWGVWGGGILLLVAHSICFITFRTVFVYVLLKKKGEKTRQRRFEIRPKTEHVTVDVQYVCS